MKQKFFMRLVAVASVLLLSAATATAYDFYDNGIYYNINSDGKSVSVTDGGYSGYITIPAIATDRYYNTYSVTAIGDYAFYGCSRLFAVEIPNSVTSIGGHAFHGCSSLTSVSIGNSVTSIGDYAFVFCSGLTSVSIGNSVTSIGEAAFNSCWRLESVEIPNSVTSIGRIAFDGCICLTWVSIGNSVTEIGEDAFYNCSGLKKVEISDLEAWCKISFYNGYANPTYYSHNLFLNGQEIKNLIIPESIQELKSFVFAGCSGLTSVKISNYVTSISKSAFIYCSGLKSVSIGNSVTKIYEYAFYECSSLTAVSIGNSVTEIGKDAFYNCSGLKKVKISDLEAWCKISFYDVDANPIYYSHNLFLNKQEIKNLIIPESIQELKSYAFYGCSGLTSVKIPNSITSIGEYVFADCSGLKKVKISDLEAWCKISFSNSKANPIYYSHNLFLNGQEIKNLIIPESIQELKSYAFYGCSGLTSVSIRNSVKSIGGSAFAYCSGLTSVSIGNSVKSIGEYAFAGCSGLTGVKIPNSITSIGEYVFADCSGLTSVEIPNSVTSIGWSAFSGCSGLTSVEIPNSVTSIGKYAFKDCSGLKLVLFNAKNCSINNRVFSSSGLTLVIGADVEKIEGQLLSSNATKIVTQAATPPVITSQTFSDKSCPLYVPKGFYVKYWTNDIWDDFSDMRAIENPITKIELNKSSQNLGTNNITQLSATITPSNATLKDIYWVSDNPAIASVDQNGKVTWLKTGITTITAMAIDGSGVKATCTVSVTTIIAENLTLNPSELTLAINQSAKITPVITPDNATSTSLEWSTSNAGVASFKANSDGSITVVGIADGVATITCHTTDGSDLTATCTVTVGTGAVDGIEADAVTVRGENGVIRVEGVDGARVEVFNTAGVCIYSGTDTEIYVPQRGLYVVKVAGRATKLAL